MPVTFIPGNNVFARCKNYSNQHDQYFQKQQRQQEMQQIKIEWWQRKLSKY